MTGKEFKEFRILWKLSILEMQQLMGLNSRGAYRNYEDRDKNVPLIFDIFFNYVNRHGLKKTKREFKRRFR